MANFKTDVHRNKTKKWTTAQSYSYDGDDWGGYDDDDAYIDEPPPPPPPASSKPTGLRQRGQASVHSESHPRTSTSSSVNPPSTASPAAVSPAPVPALPVQSQTASNPPAPPQPISANPQQEPQLRNRPSFEYGDEGAFSLGRGNVQPPTVSQARPARVDSIPAQPPAARSQQPVPPDVTALPRPWSGQGAASSPDQRQPQPPLNMQSAAAPQPAASQDPQGQQFPPRKSSLSQRSRPDVERIIASQPTKPDSGIAVEPAAPGASSPPFIRPADIYRRMEEEKRRASTDSSRPSVDGAHTRTSTQGVPELDGGNQLHSRLDAVPERQSVYGMDGFPIQEEQPAQFKLGSEFLPKIDRFSTFGDDLWGGSSFSVDASGKDSSTATLQAETSANPGQGDADREESAGELKAQPSLGFRSSVEQAFDTATAKTTLSPTTSSHYGSQRSTNPSEFARTDSTAGISPIVSRMSSAAAGARPGEERNNQTQPVSTIIEEPSNASSPPASFVPGYRRSLTPPTGDNSPAHFPKLNTAASSDPSVADMSVMSPAGRASGHRASLDANHATDFSVRESDLAAVTKSPESPEHREAGDVSRDTRASFLASHAPESVAEPQISLPPPTENETSRPDSPSKGRVRDLAGKYNDLHDTRRNSGDSISSWASSKRSASPVKSPVGTTDGASAHGEDHLRPQLPGSWVSYATTASADTAVPSPAPTHDDTAKQLSDGNNSRDSAVPDFTPSTTGNASSTASLKKATDEQRAGLTSAGAALGASLESSFGAGVASSDFAQSRGAGASNATNNSSAPSHLTPVMPAPLRGFGPSGSPRTSDVGSGPYSPTSESEFDSERLHDDIVRSLTPRAPPSDHDASSPGRLAPPSPQASGIQRESAVLPQEYDSYWDEGGRISTSSLDPPRGKGVNLTDNASQASGTPKEAKAPTRPLKHRFSWEDDDDDDDEADFQDAAEPDTVPSQTGAAASAVNVHENREPAEASKDLPTPEIAAIAPELRKESAGSEQTPLRVSTTSTASETTSPAAKAPVELKSSLNTHPITPSTPAGGDFHEAPRTAPTAVADVKGPTVPFKDILGVKSYQSRIEKYEQSRSQIAGTDSGLGRWLSHMIAIHPEHTSAASAVPALTSGGGFSGVRKITPALSKLKAAGTPYYQQYLDSGPSVSSSSAQASGGASGPIQDPNFKGRTLSQSRKDFFSTAGMIGGKATHSAKGLFAKGRSKFRQASTEKAE